VSLQDVLIWCNAIDVDAESALGTSAAFSDGGGNGLRLRRCRAVHDRAGDASRGSALIRTAAGVSRTRKASLGGGE